jgi:hypothetical protein
MDSREPTGAVGTLTTPEANIGTGPGQGTRAKEEVKTLLQDAKQETTRLAEAAREKVAESATSKKEAAAEKIDTVADVLRDAGQRLQQDTGLGQYAENAAEQVDRLAQYLRRKDLGGMVRDAETFARRHPELFLGVAFVGGMLAARFLKSSPRTEEVDLETPGSPFVQPETRPYTPGYGSNYGAGYGYQTGGTGAPGYGGTAGSPGYATPGNATPGTQPRYTERDTEPFNPPHVGGSGTPGTGGGDL